jgi:Cys-tRNA(Pro)/Cys-tRNA(Cys) deacylase
VATGTPATIALSRAGIAFLPHEYVHGPSGSLSERSESKGGYGLEAAAAIGADPDRVFKTLLADVDGIGLVVGVVPVSGTLDLKALAAAAGGKRAVMAKPEVAERRTGYVVGGISPIGQKVALPTFVDETAQLWSSVYVSGGRRGFDIELAPADLLLATGGDYADIARA